MTCVHHTSWSFCYYDTCRFISYYLHNNWNMFLETLIFCWHLDSFQTREKVICEDSLYLCNALRLKNLSRFLNSSLNQDPDQPSALPSHLSSQSFQKANRLWYFLWQHFRHLQRTGTNGTSSNSTDEHGCDLGATPMEGANTLWRGRGWNTTTAWLFKNEVQRSWVERGDKLWALSQRCSGRGTKIGTTLCCSRNNRR